ncbi:hypothetical protein SAMN04515671_2242 [Nakamurella panacisegetis]|uniref:LppP/LprE lipoprotein n=1 Tax=Nakamurella panacisegetis TaxID=1090615 RepID=A0A1H0N7P0_9ACTN|nr:hypothetical protein [Nakamurella panacisegetis]SDO88668.1 hypothetical protein SAMN04515671_2242 [Nakamurella panacisegetis]
MNTETGPAARTLLGALVGVALLVVLAGCGGTASPPPTASGPPIRDVSVASGVRSAPPPGRLTGSATAAESVASAPGLPADWSVQSIRAATAGLRACAQAATLTPPGCPQAVNTYGDALTAHWHLLNQPLEHAVAVRMEPPGETGGAHSAGRVAVFGLYQMDVSYTLAGQGLRPYRDYIGGTAAAIVTWDGSAVSNVAFPQNSALLTDLPSVTVKPFSRPAEVSDAAVLQAVTAGFKQCVTLKMPLSAVVGIHSTAPAVPNCPQQLLGGLDVNTVSASWVLNADPIQGALVSFDTQHGNFALTGSYDMTLNSVIANVPYAGPRTSRSTGTYTATLTWDGQQLTLVTIDR